MGRRCLPVFLFYDIKVEVAGAAQFFFHVIQLCAIIGDVFTVSSLISTFVEDVVLRLLQERQKGKLI